jgi:hypothetical protein
MTPRSIFQGSEKKAWFDCEKCHSSFDSKLYNVLAGYWCPYCKKKTEAILNAFLEEEYPIKKQARFSTAFFLTRGKGYYEQYKADERFNKYGLTPPFQN